MARPKNLNGARPKKEIDEGILQKLCHLHLSKKVMSDILRISVDTLDRYYAEQIDVWQSESKGKIASVLFDEALNKRTDWALKQISQKHLDYADRTKSETDFKGQFATMDDKELDNQIAEKIAKLNEISKK